MFYSLSEIKNSYIQVKGYFAEFLRECCLMPLGKDERGASDKGELPPQTNDWKGW